MAIDKKFGEYGNNYFKLTTKLGGQDISIEGVLTEVPPISLSCEWGDGPAASIASFISETVNNEFFEFAAQGADSTKYSRFVASDTITNRMFTGGGKFSFDLKFRVYTNQRIGSQTLSNMYQVVNALANAYPLAKLSESEIKTLATRMLNNVESAAKGLKDAFAKARADSQLAQTWADSESIASEFKHAQSVVGASNYLEQEQMIDSEDTRNNLDNAITATTDAGSDNGQITVIGAPIWSLKILPCFFKKDLPVMITDFNITPSKECVTTMTDQVNKTFGHVSWYYDISITCEVCRVFSSDTMAGYMYP